jgi:hypothetical protein
MQQYRCVKCKNWLSETDTEAKTEEVISYDRAGRFIGSTRVKICGDCIRKETPAAESERQIPRTQKRLF